MASLTSIFNPASERDFKILGLLLSGYLEDMYLDGRHVPDVEHHEHEVLYVVLNGPEGSGKSTLAYWMTHMPNKKYETTFAETGHDIPKKAWQNKLSLDGEWQNRIYDTLLEYSIFKPGHSKDIENAIMPARTRPGIEIIENLSWNAESDVAKEILSKAVKITIDEEGEILFFAENASEREMELYKELEDGAREMNLM